MAQVLDKSPMYVLRMAQLLPPISKDQQIIEARTPTEAEQKLLAVFRSLQAQDREAVTRIIYSLAQPSTAKEQEMWDTFRGLQPADHETIARMLDALAGGQGGEDNSE